LTPVDYIAGWEGYSGVAYWDVNHWRIGFGSDTEGPDQVNVVEGMTTTRARALQNLSLRISQFQAIAARSMGPSTWAGLSDAQHTALTSLVYNYGRLPIRVYDHDPEKTAAEIAALQTANGGVNKKRRVGEATLYLTGTPAPTQPNTSVVVGAGLTGTGAALVAFYTWFMQISGTDRVLLSLVIAQTLLILYLTRELLAKQPDVIIHPVPPPEELELVTNLKQARARQAVAASNLANAAKEVEDAKQELNKTIGKLQSEIEL
jgi:GH24 family phage-related lysozyme (muramidase)